MTLGPDPYTVLGVPRDAGEDQIAQARRRLSREYHPDVNPAPDAAGRFDEVQRAFHLLSDPAARSQYDRAHDEQGRPPVTRDPSGGYGLATEAPHGILIQPAAVDFGRLTPKRPRADASHRRLDRGSARPPGVHAEGRVVGEPGTPNGRQQAQFTVIFDDTTLTVRLTAEIQGEFAPGSRPDFTPLPQPGPDSPRPSAPFERRLWLVMLSALGIVLLVMVATH